jgi:hypothetical protein
VLADRSTSPTAAAIDFQPVQVAGSILLFTD